MFEPSPSWQPMIMDKKLADSMSLDNMSDYLSDLSEELARHEDTITLAAMAAIMSSMAARLHVAMKKLDYIKSIKS